MSASTLASLAEKAVKWSAMTTVARFVLQLGAQVALARLLGPGNYGIYGIGIAVLTFAGFLAGAGFSWNLMLAPHVDDDDVRFAFTWQTLAGTAMAAAMYFGAPLLADFFGDARVQPMVRWLALACVLTALSAPSICLLQRDLNFRVLGLVQLVSYAMGYLAVGLPLALAGWGAQSLAMAAVVQAAVLLVGTYGARRHPVRPLWRHATGGQALDTGRTVFYTNVVNWVLGNLDRIIIGRLLNAHAAGLFTLAYNFAQIPHSLLVNAVQPTFLASGAKLSAEPQRLAQAWMLVLGCVLVLVLPAAVSMSLVAPDLVDLLYGSAWNEAGWVLAVMFLCLPAWTGWGLSTPVLWNTGRKHQEALLQLPLLALALPAWWWITPHGLRGAVLVSAVVIYLRAGLIVAAGLRALGMSGSVLLPLLLRGGLLALWCGVATRAAQALVEPLGLPAVSLAAGTLAALAAMAIVVWGLPHLLGEQARLALSRLLPFVRAAAPAGVPPVAKGSEA
ncbi:oligosaccharide flippase family protein [Ramlibacter sp. AW1]|uniref:Oligosaccharide flippase family protein n=1 Tax=Ramlibacter aurantiacus TaxID=2801330 RepID=A0A936ZGG9_9BURK|nr:oligosaccharide flippase family protein [Ramlibacter aurantiacus]MBL0421014.1 oligosaccharide flippase family protein [Ramlibacter aurantiacus]